MEKSVQLLINDQIKTKNDVSIFLLNDLFVNSNSD